MKLYEIFTLLLLGMIVFMPVALIVFLPRIKKDDNDENNNSNE